MAYTLQAFISASGHFPQVLPVGLRRIALPAGLELIPLDDLVRQAFELPFLPLTDEGSAGLPSNVAELGRMLSERSQVAYVEAEYFGGKGSQAAVRFAMGALVDQPLLDADAINQALRWLGVRCTDASDEFDAAGLGVHRGPEEWR